MTVLERIKTLCKEKKNISLTTLEHILEYSNGSLSKCCESKNKKQGQHLYRCSAPFFI